MARPNGRKLCRNCGVNHINRPLGLCWHCYYAPGIREQYPSESKFSRHYGEPTEEELEAIIAEQMANLPDWTPEAIKQGLGGRAHRIKGTVVKVTLYGNVYIVRDGNRSCQTYHPSLWRKLETTNAK